MVKKHRIISIDGFIHILSDDDIKEGDWVFDGDEVWRCDDYKEEFKSPYSDEFKKIIATTDPKLVVRYKGYEHRTGDKIDAMVYLPQIPQNLVKHYAKHQPEEVELEYNVTYYANPDDNTQIVNLKLQDNEVVWVEPRVQLVSEFMTGQKLYTREEVGEEKESVVRHFASNMTDIPGGEVEQWIEKNI